MYPSHLPVWPGREAIRARRRPCENCSTNEAATSASFLRASIFFWTAADFGPLKRASSSSVNLAFFLRPRVLAQWASYHCLNGVQSIVTMQPLTRVLVRTNSLLEALYTTSITRTFRETASVAQEKLP